MEHIRFNYKDICGVSEATIGRHLMALTPETDRMRAALNCEYTNEYASLNAPFDMHNHEIILKHAQHVQALKPALLIVIGIGGSNLGTVAVHHALQGLLYNEMQPSCRFYCADTVDERYIKTLLCLAEQALILKQPIIITIISKSGTTTETIANGMLFIELLKKYYPDTWHTYVYVTTDADSALDHFAHHCHIQTLQIPSLIGGRYSVLSAVGLFPLALLGIDIHMVCAGARDAIIDTFSQKTIHTIPALSAAIMYELFLQQYTIHDTFVFDVALESFGKWYRQLCAESLGKEYTIDQEQAYRGITPTVSVGSTDLHSVGQLYLGGPYDKYTTFISSKEQNSLIIPSMNHLETLVPNIAHKSISYIMQAILQGTQKAYHKGKRPFVHIELDTLSAYCMGQLLQYKMIEVMYLGFLLRVNPFDQPQVELYKSETRKILAS